MSIPQELEALQVVTLYFFVAAMGPLSTWLFWRLLVVSVVMVLARYLGETNLMYPSFGFLIGLETSLLQLRQNKSVDFISRPVLIVKAWKRRLLWWNKCPMFFVNSALFNPFLNQFNLLLV